MLKMNNFILSFSIIVFKQNFKYFLEQKIMAIIAQIFLILSLTIMTSTSFTVELQKGLDPNRPTFFFAGDFQTNWGIWNYLEVTSTLGTKSYMTLTFRNATYYDTKDLGVNNVKIRGHSSNSALNSWYVLLDDKGYFRTYQYDNMTFTYQSTQIANDIEFIFSDYEVVFVNKTLQKISKLNCLSNTITTNISLINKSPTQVQPEKTRITVYSQDSLNVSLAWFTIYDINLTKITQFSCPYRAQSLKTVKSIPLLLSGIKTKYNHTFNLQQNGSLLVRTYSTIVQIWNITDGILIHSKNLNQQVFQAFICMSVLVIQLAGKLNFYQYGTWTFVTYKQYLFGPYLAFMKCVQAQQIITVYSPQMDAHVDFVRITMQSNTTNNTTNSTNSNTNTLVTNSSTSNNTNSNTTSPSTDLNPNVTLDPNTLPNSSQFQIPSDNLNQFVYDASLQLSKYLGIRFSEQLFNSTNRQILREKFHITQKQLQLLQTAYRIIKSKQSQMLAKSMGFMGAVSMTSSILTSFLRPLGNLFEQFWLYAYHKRMYPLTVELFANQVDVLNMIKFNPYSQFLKSLHLQNEKLNETNQYYSNCSMFQYYRKPDSIYFELSLVTICLSNFILSCGIFILNVLCFIITKRLSYIGQIIKKISNYFKIRKNWWIFVLIVMSPSVRSISFYCFARLTIPSNVHYYGKIDLVLVLSILGIMVGYTFVFYPLAYRYSKKRVGKQVLEVTSFNFKSFVLQMSLNCVRGFFQAFVHASIVNRHEQQVVFLLVVDVFIFAITLKLRKHFSHNFTFLVTLAYLLTFIGFDVMIILYTLCSLQQFNYELTFLIIILALSALTILKMLFLILRSAYRFIKQSMDNCKKKQQIIQKQNQINNLVILNKIQNGINNKSTLKKQKKDKVTEQKKQKQDNNVQKPKQKKKRSNKKEKPIKKQKRRTYLLKINPSVFNHISDELSNNFNGVIQSDYLNWQQKIISNFHKQKQNSTNHKGLISKSDQNYKINKQKVRNRNNIRQIPIEQQYQVKIAKSIQLDQNHKGIIK